MVTREDAVGSGGASKGGEGRGGKLGGGEGGRYDDGVRSVWVPRGGGAVAVLAVVAVVMA
jgi:hypothetical protein